VEIFDPELADLLLELYKKRLAGYQENIIEDIIEANP